MSMVLPEEALQLEHITQDQILTVLILEAEVHLLILMPEEVMEPIPDLAVTLGVHPLQLEVVLIQEEALAREEAALALHRDHLLVVATEEEVINKTFLFYEKAIFHGNGPFGHYFFSSSRHHICR